MKQLIIIVKPFRAEAVLKLIEESGVDACIVREAKGWGRQKHYLERYVGSEYNLAFLPKVEISVWVEDSMVDELAQRITRVACTGRIGDGKVFVVPCSHGEPIEF
jgi:nitrogen regulatory protein PII